LSLKPSRQVTLRFLIHCCCMVERIVINRKPLQMALESQPNLDLSSSSPSVGPNEAKAAVVMFFDYQCSWCSKMAPVVENLIKTN
ncbi:hypothetical protein MJL48_28915, partial [Salmonella enterica subsp. enterica serovar Kentucky]|nr:hypothetical protein [Salmonella enterica subsp. enterica serovar Kentucky]